MHETRINAIFILLLILASSSYLGAQQNNFEKKFGFLGGLDMLDYYFLSVLFLFFDSSSVLAITNAIIFPSTPS